MGDIGRPEPVKLIFGMLSGYPRALSEAEGRIVDAVGPVDVRSDVLAFEFTEYYRDEMGRALARYFVAAEALVDPGRLAELKHVSNRIEAEIAALEDWDVARPVNIDPGYVEPSKLVLASTKNFSHRVYLGDGIWGEVTLRWRGGGWQPLEWTFPDYRTEPYHTFLTRVRKRLRHQLRGEGAE